MVDKEKLRSYIIKVIQDAYKSENREYDPSKISWYAVLVDGGCLYGVWTPYLRVTSRIEYRLKNNLKKHFNLKDRDEVDYFVDSIFQINFSTNKFKVGKQNYYVCERRNYASEESGSTLPSGHYEKLCMAYHNVGTEEFMEMYKTDDFKQYGVPLDLKWNEYREIYKKAFGKYPEVKCEIIAS